MDDQEINLRKDRVHILRFFKCSDLKYSNKKNVYAWHAWHTIHFKVPIFLGPIQLIKMLILVLKYHHYIQLVRYLFISDASYHLSAFWPQQCCMIMHWNY